MKAESKYLFEKQESQHKEYYWQTLDGIKIFAQSWQPAHKPKGLIILVHGLGDHSSRYGNWASKLTDVGFAVITSDLRGHGRSEGKRGYARSFSKYLNDCELLVQQAGFLFPGTYKILYGHSLGGNIVVNYITSRQADINALIISAPWFSLAFKPSRIKYIAGNILQHIMPGKVISTGLNPEHTSRDIKSVYLYKKDPLIHYKISMKLFFEILNAGTRASKSIYKINVPVLVMHGTADKITSFNTTQNFVQNAGYYTTFKEWPGYFHELHFDIGADQVFLYLSDWLNGLFKEE
ncbi:MAG: lysophospholipase [Bacteroidales bacterium]|nr:lysophospholipase [Bacteroidales bacterium]